MKLNMRESWRLASQLLRLMGKSLSCDNAVAIALSL